MNFIIVTVRGSARFSAAQRESRRFSIGADSPDERFKFRPPRFKKTGLLHPGRGVATAPFDFLNGTCRLRQRQKREDQGEDRAGLDDAERHQVVRESLIGFTYS